MSESVEIVCLANSRKLKGHCVAGIRLDGGGWFRPVSSRPGGQLSALDCSYEDGGIASVLDVVSVPVLEPCPSALQPENCFIDEQCYWEKLRDADQDDITLVQESLTDGSLLFGCDANKVPYGPTRSYPRSLCLVEPEGLSFVVKSKKFYDKLQARAVFHLGNERYDLPVTDLVYEELLLGMGEGKYEVDALGISPAAQLLLAVSLGEPLYDYCYKLVAGLVEIDNGCGGLVKRGSGSRVEDDAPEDEVHPLCPRHLSILQRVGEGLSYEQIVARHPDVTYLDIFAAARAAVSLSGAVTHPHSHLDRIRSRYPRAYLPWTDEEEARLLQLFGEGRQGIDAIAELLGRQRGAIASRLHALGITAGDPLRPI